MDLTIIFPEGEQIVLPASVTKDIDFLAPYADQEQLRITNQCLSATQLQTAWETYQGMLAEEALPKQQRQLLSLSMVELQMPLDQEQLRELLQQLQVADYLGWSRLYQYLLQQVELVIASSPDRIKARTILEEVNQDIREDLLPRLSKYYGVPQVFPNISLAHTTDGRVYIGKDYMLYRREKHGSYQPVQQLPPNENYFFHRAEACYHWYDQETQSIKVASWNASQHWNFPCLKPEQVGVSRSGEALLIMISACDNEVAFANLITKEIHRAIPELADEWFRETIGGEYLRNCILANASIPVGTETVTSVNCTYALLWNETTGITLRNNQTLAIVAVQIDLAGWQFDGAGTSLKFLRDGQYQILALTETSLLWIRGKVIMELSLPCNWSKPWVVEWLDGVPVYIHSLDDVILDICVMNEQTVVIDTAGEGWWNYIAAAISGKSYIIDRDYTYLR